MAVTRRAEPALSDLSVTEFLVLSRAGFLPMGLVIGTSVYDAGFTWVMGQTREIPELGNAMHAARKLAVERMRTQAKEHGAEGVVGVRLQVEHHRWRGGHTVAKFVALGTAVAFDREHAPQKLAHAPSLLLAGGRPFTSDLSGQDFVTLLRAGYRPVDLAMGSSVYEIDPSMLQSNVMGLAGRLVPSWDVTVELVEYTQAFFNAREGAMDRLEEDLHKDHPRGTVDDPSGIVGVTVDEKVHGGQGFVVEYSAIGTAVAPLAEGDPRRHMQLPNPTIVVPLDR
jgi:uncharacterized protein YbjQ (UPF0145 family)